jgi:uncharacterized protein (TIGR02246 family)
VKGKDLSRTTWALALLAVVLGVLIWLSRKPKEADTADDGASWPAPDRATAAEAEVKDVRQSINTANAACVAALEAGDARAYAQFFADDGVSLPGRGPVVRGKTAIQDAMEQAFRKVRFSEAAWETLETRFNGKMAYEIGAYRFIVRPAGRGPAQKMSGRYFVVWKQVGGDWKIMVDAAQPGAPAQ